jgi:Ca-activated chloride channel family protein
MKFAAALDVNVVAHETTDEVAVLLDLQAPAVTGAGTRPPASLEVVLDRSGSMSGPPLEGAKKALVSLVHRLDPQDHFGLVTFDDTAQVVVPAGPLTDKAAVIQQIQAIQSGGMTDLSAGYLRGLRELRRTADGRGGTVLVISDGHVNSGIGDPDEFGSVTSKAYADGIVTSTLGYGEGYDETLLAAIAKAGSGNHVFAADPDAAGAAIAQEVDGLLDKAVQAVTLTIHFEPTVQMLQLYNDLPAQQVGDGKVMVELGDLYAEEERKLLVRLEVPAMAALGLAQIATLELQYVELPGLVEHSVKLPISVNVVPGDEAAARVPDPTVRSEVLFQEAQQAKRSASEAFERDDRATGLAKLAEARMRLGEAGSIAPAPAAMAITAELDDVDRMAAMTEQVGTAYMSKMTRDSYHRQNRKRGRRPGGAPGDGE